MALLDLSAPERLLWLLALPLLWLLARPLRPRTQLLTPHLQQWLAARDRLGRRRIRFPRLRYLLLAAAFCAGALAFAGARTGARAGPTRLVVLLDTTASMAAVTGTGVTAFAAAVERVRSQLLALPREIRVAVDLVGAEVTVLDGDAEAILRRLPAAPAGRSGLDLVQLADQLAAADTAVWCVTDGQMLRTAPARAALALVGRSVANAGIVGLEVEDRWPLPEITFTVTLANLASTVRAGALRLSGGVEPLAEQTLDLAPGETRTLRVPARRAAGGEVTLSLGGPADALPADDQVVVTVRPPAQPDLAWLADTDDPRMLRAAAASLAAESGGRVVPAGAATQASLLLAEGGVLPATAAQLRAITFGTRFSAEPLAADRIGRDLVVSAWSRTSPLTVGLDLSDLRVASALLGEVPPGEILIASDRGPLAVLVAGPGTGAVHFAFRLSDSNLGFLPAFPQLLRRAFAACYGATSPAVVPAGLVAGAEESDLRPCRAGPDRPLPAFGSAGRSLALPLLLLAMLCLAARVYT